MNWGWRLSGWKPHGSHRMTTWDTAIRCPGSEPRFYSVRACKRCGAEEGKHAAGHYADRELDAPCCGAKEEQ